MTREQRMLQYFKNKGIETGPLEKLVNKFDLKITNVKMGYSIDEQIKEAERELAMRKSFYAKQVNAGKMDKETARKRYDLQQAIVTTLKWLKDGES